jgi:hypothetical protein
MELSTNAGPGYLLATASGDFVLAEANQQFLGLIDQIARDRTRHILVDGRAVTGAPRAIERYLYSVFAARAAETLLRDVHVAPKFAYVLTPPVLDPHRMGEKLARHRGMNMRAFESVDEAVKWLIGPDR